MPNFFLIVAPDTLKQKKLAGYYMCGVIVEPIEIKGCQHLIHRHFSFNTATLCWNNPVTVAVNKPAAMWTILYSSNYKLSVLGFTPTGSNQVT